MTVGEMNALSRLIRTAASKRAPQAKRTAAVKAIKKATKGKSTACPR